MSGPHAKKVAAEKARLEELSIGTTGRSRLAVDLGCGPGYQAFALAELGFQRVLALDTSEDLLGELRANICGRPIEPVRMDILRLGELVEVNSVDCVTCMGDTLTHLASREDVTGLFCAIRKALAPAGAFVLSFRDLTQPRSGPDRFLMSRSDHDRILRCFLEYVDDDFVCVHDILHQRDGDRWTMRVSAYLKLRLSPDWVAQQLRGCGLDVVAAQPDAGGWTILRAKCREDTA
jgi:SAM-dependent methyltransferase